MNAFLALVRKDILLYFQNRRAVLFGVVMPVLMAAFFGFVFGGSGQSTGGKADVALVVQDTGAAARKVAAALRSDAMLHVTDVASLADAEALVRKGKQGAAIVIPAGFGEAAGSALFGAGPKPRVTVLYDPSQPAVLSLVKGLLIQNVMQTVSGEMMGGPHALDFAGKRMQELETRADPEAAPLKAFLGHYKDFVEETGRIHGTAARPAGMSLPFATAERPVAAPGPAAGYNGYAHAFAGMSVQFLLFAGTYMGIALLLARENGLWQRILAAPVSLDTLLASRVVSGTLIALANLLVIFGAAVLLFGVRIANPPGLLMVAVGFASMASSFGLLVAAFGKNPEAARGLASFAVLVMVMLGGAWVPSFLFPAWLQTLTLAVPTRWAVDGFDGMTWRGLGLDAAALTLAVELGFALLFAMLATWRFRREAAAA